MKRQLARNISSRLHALGDRRDTELLLRFFKTGTGQYGHHDRFLGIRVPATRRLLAAFPEAGIDEAAQLLASDWHEERLFALLLLVREYQRAGAAEQRRIYNLYLANTRHINNWDLVDTSAAKIVGAHLDGRSRAPLMRLAVSRSLWERRIAMVATLHWIKRGEPSEALRIAELLLGDREDLMHKAVGWMLREVGKRCGRAHLASFLDRHASIMPRTALRYALEHFTPVERTHYMNG